MGKEVVGTIRYFGGPRKDLNPFRNAGSTLTSLFGQIMRDKC
jgi:hypothetical protein